MCVYINTGSPGTLGNQEPHAKGEKGEAGAPGKSLTTSGRVYHTTVKVKMKPNDIETKDYLMTCIDHTETELSYLVFLF